MDLASLDTRKALAFDAACRGQREIAERLYAELLPHYERHGAFEGLLVIQFNRLLMALEDEDWHVAGNLVLDLTDRLEALEGVDSPQVRSVAQGVWTLFRHPEDPLDPTAVRRLASLAAQWTGGHGHGEPPADEVHERAEQISPAVLATLPADHALRLVVAANITPRAGATEGLAALSGALQGLLTPEETDGGPIELEDYREAVRGADAFRAYQHLVTAFEQALKRHLLYATDMLVELGRMEAEGLPDRLAYAPSLPVERRLRAAAVLHSTFADVMARRAGWSAAARVQYTHVIALADRWTDRMRARAARGGGRGGDVMGEATMALLKAEALNALGERQEAQDALAEWLLRAMRGTIGNPILGSRVLMCAAGLAERRGDRDGAAQLFASAADAALANMTRGCSLTELADRLDDLIADGDEARVALAARGLAGYARNRTHRGGAMGLLARGKHLLTLARPHLPVRSWISAALELELSLSLWGSETAAHRAVELAQAIDDPQARALALLHRAVCTLERSTDVSNTAFNQSQPIQDVLRAAAEIRNACRGAVRRTVELAAALYPPILEGEADPDRVEVHLRRAAEGGGLAAWSEGSGPLDMLRPRDARLTALEGIRLALSLGRPELARRLAASVRQGRLTAPVRGAEPSWIPALMAHHRGIFERWSRVGERGLFDPAVLDRMSHWQPESNHRRLEPAAGEALLEATCFEGGVYLFLSTAEGTWSHWWPIKRDDLHVMLQSLPALLHPAALQRNLAQWCGEAYDALLGPFEAHLEGIERLLTAFDAPLDGVPTALLYGGAFVCEHLATLMACPVQSHLGGERSAELAPAVAVIIGDGVIARDLQLSTLAQEGHYSTVEVRHGSDLEPSALHHAIPRARAVYVVGEITEEGIALRDDHPPVAPDALAQALSAAGVTCAILQGPLRGLGGQRAVQALLAEVPAVICRRWETSEYSPEFVMACLRHAANARTAVEYSAALRKARQEAIARREPPHQWAAYELYCAEWC
ncbi:MAG: hypothetical protein ACE366_06590 [Bradymonadia bacterium]